MLRAYSITQIQFECLRYIKEFGADPGAWLVGTCVEPEQHLRDTFGADRDQGIWLAKPALTASAATAVVDTLHARYRVPRAVPSCTDPSARTVFLVKATSA